MEWLCIPASPAYIKHLLEFDGLFLNENVEENSILH